MHQEWVARILHDMQLRKRVPPEIRDCADKQLPAVWNHRVFEEFAVGDDDALIGQLMSQAAGKAHLRQIAVSFDSPVVLAGPVAREHTIARGYVSVVGAGREVKVDWR
jgi:hypothetical protein